jgi:uncharacterized cupin superfamily protein
MARRHPNVANLDEIEAEDGPSVGVFRSTLRSMGGSTGGSKLGCTYTTVQPGAVAWPYHWHAANEEVIIVAAGHGTLRIGEATVEVRAGDYVTCRTGVAHQLSNTGTEPLTYWCLSTMIDPEVCGYPDSGKAGASTRQLASGPFRHLFPIGEGHGVGYFDNDPLAQPDAKL